jgi:predicted MFS family arabinose efflux permease
MARVTQSRRLRCRRSVFSTGTVRSWRASLDSVAYGVSGPVAGVIASQFGYPAVYLFGAVCALLGVALVVTP